LEIIQNSLSYTVDFLTNLPALSNWIDRSDSDFLHGWTVFYWAWWISWSPFVGMFIARVSRGRSVREFLVGTIIFPSVISIVWLTLFGDNAINQFLSEGNRNVIDTIQNQSPEMSIYKFLEGFPFSEITSLVAITLICIFFITSMDSGALVIDTIASNGKTNTPVQQRILWCLLIGLIAIALTLSGGLGALQSMALATAFPFCFILLSMCVSTSIGIYQETEQL
jgi:BCCT family betaine/carnitine transporter